MSSNQLPEVVVGFSGPPHPRMISKLSQKYWRDKHLLWQESMPVIPVNPNHPAASAACKRTPSAAVRESPPRAAKARADNALMQHGASASPPQCHDVASASVAVASVATDAGLRMPLVSLLLLPSLPPPLPPQRVAPHCLTAPSIAVMIPATAMILT